LNDDMLLETLEAAEILISGKKINPKKLPKITNLNDLVFPFDISDGGEGEIIKEYCPRYYRYCADSKTSNGDKIKGINLWGFSSNPIKNDEIKFGTKRSRSGKHQNQECTMKGPINFLTIIETWSHKTLNEHPSSIFLSPSSNSKKPDIE